MNETPWWRRFEVWRRALMVVAGVLALVPQYFTLPPLAAQAIAFAIAVVNLVLGLLPQKALARLWAGVRYLAF